MKCKHIYGYDEEVENKLFNDNLVSIRNDFSTMIDVPFTFCPKCGKKLCHTKKNYDISVKCDNCQYIDIFTIPFEVKKDNFLKSSKCVRCGCRGTLK